LFFSPSLIQVFPSPVRIKSEYPCYSTDSLSRIHVLHIKPEVGNMNLLRRETAPSYILPPVETSQLTDALFYIQK
jgi:hypothetical protein